MIELYEMLMNMDGWVLMAAVFVFVTIILN